MNLLVKLKWAVLFPLFYVKNVFVANLRVAKDVLSPRIRLHTGFIRVPLKATSNMEILALSNLVSMTPGTLSIDVSPDRKFLYVHCLYLQEIDKTRRQIGENLQRRVLEGLR